VILIGETDDLILRRDSASNDADDVGRNADRVAIGGADQASVNASEDYANVDVNASESLCEGSSVVYHVWTVEVKRRSASMLASRSPMLTSALVSVSTSVLGLVSPQASASATASHRLARRSRHRPRRRNLRVHRCLRETRDRRSRRSLRDALLTLINYRSCLVIFSYPIVLNDSHESETNFIYNTLSDSFFLYTFNLCIEFCIQTCGNDIRNSSSFQVEFLIAWNLIISLVFKYQSLHLSVFLICEQDLFLRIIFIIYFFVMS